jgi:L-asparagine transporter-like permease
VATIGALWVWGIIVYAHLKYRKRKQAKNDSFKMPGYPVTNWIVILFLVMVAVLLAFSEDTRVALYVAPFWFGILAISYQFIRKRNNQIKND